MSEKSISTPSAKGDDRNLVPVDSGNAVTFEDQLQLIWKNHRNTIIGLIAVLVLAIIGLQVWRMLESEREAATQAAFGAATTVEAKRAFARDHAGHPLAGAALLYVADESYKNGRFEEAAREYASASAALTEPLLVGRSRIGEAVSALKAGQTTKGEQLLTKIAEDPTVLLAYRAQAYYEIATFAESAGDIAKARDSVDKCRALDPESFWANVATTLRERLSADAPAPVPEGASGGQTPPVSP
jgi:hypothetical protein